MANYREKIAFLRDYIANKGKRKYSIKLHNEAGDAIPGFCSLIVI